MSLRLPLRNTLVRMPFAAAVRDGTLQPIWRRALGSTRWRYAVLLVLLIVIISTVRLSVMWIDSQYWGTRAPYLQRPGPHAVSVHWQSTEAVQGALRYRLRGTEDWQWLHEDAASLVHELRLSGLQAGQNYEYEVWEQQRRVYGPYHFRSWPEPSSAVQQSVRFWVLGDPGLNSALARQVRESSAEWLQHHPHRGAPLDLWFTTGDNAYTSGRNREYQNAIFDPLGDVLAQVPLFPVYGNHDARRWAFYQIFDLPSQAESGGLASGCEAYYAVDYGAVHWVILDSQDRAGAEDGQMARWLSEDLAASQARWKIAIFHHPPYSHGSHNSDTSGGSDWRLHAMRENFLPILERGGVDLVLAGHSHAYERSHLLHGHYGPGTSFDPSYILDAGSDWGARRHYQQSTTTHPGTMYVVLGNSAEVHGGEMNHPALPVAMAVGGSLMIEVTQNCLHGDMVAASGEVADAFSLVKPGVECERNGPLEAAEQTAPAPGAARVH